MTENEAKSCIQGKLDCMNKCDVFDCKGTDECENCNYCYSQGNFGEQKKAFEMAIQSLEEIQQYRAIGTVEEIQQKDEVIATQRDIIEGVYKDYEKYLKIGTIEEFKALKEKSEPKDCSTCANNTDFDEVDNGCYMCCKGLENNYQPKGE